MLTVGSLFSGIEGFGLGLERTGMRVVWHCDSDPFARAVIAKHWPDNPIYDDVRTLRGADAESVDVLCGGSPCQDLSNSWQGTKAGIDGARSGLWAEFARLVGELRPSYVIVENVAAIRRGALGRFLGDLAALGFDAEWSCIPASAVGAPHQRDRAWIVAYPEGCGRPGGPSIFAPQGPLVGAGAGAGNRAEPRDSAAGVRLVGAGVAGGDGRGAALGGGAAAGSSWWASEPSVDRLAHGVSGGLVRRRALGNALVPQIAQWIGERILEHERGEADRAA